ncbi:RnfABCDGE type electron transport complex subunit D [Deferrisoma sp.]
MSNPNDPKWILSSSPHVFEGESTARIMWQVVAALAPAALWGVYAFGPRALWVIGWCIVGAALAEEVSVRLRGRPSALGDGSAVLTGLLLAMNLPATSPWWMALVGGAVAIVLGKQVFGGLGQNPFNPALVARVFLLVSFPVAMTDWRVPGGALADAVTAATPLGAAKTAVATHGALGDALAGIPWWKLFVGLQPGSLGEVSELLLLAGAAYLLWRRIVTWDIPVAFLGTLVGVTAIAWAARPAAVVPPWTQLVAGGAVLGACFMATDMVTSPLTARGRWIFGIGCGLLTAVIRLWGGYPEGVSFAILLMNAAVPLIDRFTRPRKFGWVPQERGAS